MSKRALTLTLVVLTTCKAWSEPSVVSDATPAAEQPAPDQPERRQPAPEQPAPEQPAPEQPAPEQPAPEQPAPEPEYVQQGGVGAPGGKGTRLLPLLVPVRVDVTRLRGAKALVEKLKSDGFSAHIYKPEMDEGPYTAPGHSAIWIGCEVPPAAIIASIQIAKEHWPHLKYAELSCDGDSDPPEEIHEQMYFGGDTNTARESRLRAWTDQDFADLRPEMTRKEIFAAVRGRYGR